MPNCQNLPFGVSLSDLAMPHLPGILCAEYRRCHWCRLEVPLVPRSLCHFWDLEGWCCDPCWLWYEIEDMTDYYMQELVEEMPQCTVIATEVFAQRHLMRSICSFLTQVVSCYCEDCIEEWLDVD